MSRAYIIAEIDIHDPEGFAEYRAAVAPMIAEFGGRYLVRGGEVTSLEGEPQNARVVVLEFPSMGDAQTFWNSDEYRPVAAVRQRSATSRLFMVEGIPS